MSFTTIGIIGSSEENPELNDIAEEMGKLIAQSAYSLVTGGKNGVMQAASRGAQFVDGKAETSKVIGILPGFNKSESNEYVDISIPTGIGWARNQQVILSSDVIVAIGGGAGTLSEIAFAWAYKKPIIAFEDIGGWSSKLAGEKIDPKRTDLIISVSTPSEAIQIIKELINK